ncbi:unnamed protein product, partial [marine sediment metagenome]
MKPRNILLTIVGATFEVIGRAAVVPDNFKEANINQAIAKITVHEEINPYYVEAFLNSSFGQVQIQRFARPVAQININLRELQKILIPIPPRSVQDDIALLMQDAYQISKQKLDTSVKLLESINDFILHKLGIRLEPLHHGPFKVSSRDFLGRLDVEYYLPHYLKFQKQLVELR